jgi:hypothetical protein
MNFRFGNPGTFFPWPGEPEGSDKGIKIRVLTPGMINQIDAETTEEKWIMVDRIPIREKVVTDQEKRERMRLDYIIMDWKGYTVDGEEVPYTPENKVKCVNDDPVLSKFILLKLEELQEEIERIVRGEGVKTAAKTRKRQKKNSL